MKIKGRKPTKLLPVPTEFNVDDYVIAKNGSIGRVYKAGTLTCQVLWERLDGVNGFLNTPTAQLKHLDKETAEALLQHRKYEKEINN